MNAPSLNSKERQLHLPKSMSEKSEFKNVEKNKYRIFSFSFFFLPILLKLRSA